MAYMSQENKKEKLAKMKDMIKTKYPEFKVRFTMGVRHYSTLVFNLWKSTIDFKKIFENDEFMKNKGYFQVNEYYLENNFEGKILEFFKDVKAIMMEGNHDNSDIQTDYFDVGWYIDINIGKYDKPYEKV